MHEKATVTSASCHLPELFFSPFCLPDRLFIFTGNAQIHDTFYKNSNPET